MEHQENVNHGAGQSVNISFGAAPWVVVGILVLVLVASLIFSVRSSMKADAAERASLAYAAEHRSAAYWMQTMAGNCLIAGVKPTPIPASFK